jgi:processive 1,2-diacylglycerol beta-glucosyltransferase
MYRYSYVGEAMSAIQLYKEHPDTYEREVVGSITEKQLDFLVENLEEEFEEDEEYFLDADTIDYLKEQGADSDLVAILEKALAGTQDGVDIFYLLG